MFSQFSSFHPLPWSHFISGFSFNKISRKFYRVDKSHSREIGGTGLGLSITRNIILLHKGTIKAESTLGEGSKFLVKIPLFYILDKK